MPVASRCPPKSSFVESLRLTPIKVWFDGGSYGNGYQFQGYGSYEVDGGVKLHHKSTRQDFGSPITNNEAEYLSLLAALRWLQAQIVPERVGLEIWGDSQLVVQQVNRCWRVRKEHLKPLRDEARDLLRPYLWWELKWYPRKWNVNRFGH